VMGYAEMTSARESMTPQETAWLPTMIFFIFFPPP
jgi:hypothetical protein